MAGIDSYLDDARNRYAAGPSAPPTFQPTPQPFPASSGGGAMSGSVSVTPAAPAPNAIDYSTPFAMDKATGKLYAGGQEIPTDISAWQQVAAQDPSKITGMPRSVIQQHDLVPMSHEELQAAIKQITDNATAPVLSNAWEGVKSGYGAMKDAGARLAANPYVNSFLGPNTGQVDANGQYSDPTRDMVAAGARQSIKDTAADMAKDQADTRAGLSMQQQAGQDAHFTQHPGTFIAGRLGSFAGSAGPLIAGTLANPTLGGAMIVGQSAGGSAQDAEGRIRTAMENMSPEDLAKQSPAYAQLTQAGMPDDQAREQLVQRAGDTAGLVGGGIGLATIPLFDIGAKGLSALAPSLSRAAAGAGESFVAKALTGQGLPGTLTRAAVRGVEGSGLMQAQQSIANASGAAAAGVGSTNPWDYVSGQQFLEGTLGFAAMGAATPMHRAADPVGTARASDLGAAADAVTGKPDQPGPNAPADFGAPADRGDLNQPAYMRRGDQPQRATPDMILSQMFGQGWRDNPKAVFDAADTNPEVRSTLQAAVHDQPLWSADRVVPQQGQAGDMFGGAPRDPAAPVDNGPAPVDTPPNPVDPNQLPLAPQPDLGPRGQLIRQRAAELANPQVPSDTPVAALPPPGPTEGQTGRVASAQQSLDLVNQMLESNQFNKRTKTGKATLASLAAEKARLEAEVQQADNDVLGEQIGQARAERPPVDPGVSKVIDEQGQMGLPGVDPGADPRLTGELPPPGAKPGDSVPPVPLPNPEPMSPEEAASRLAAQRARRPDRQEPQQDAFPRELRQGLQERVAQGDAVRTSEEGVSPSTPEPKADLQAQADRLGKGSDAMFVARGNEDQMPSVRRGVRKVVRDEGTLFTTNAEKAKAYREAPNVDDALLARMQDLPETKAAAMRSPNPSVVAAEDASGNVVKEAVGTPGGPNDAVVAAATPAGGRTVRRDALTAQARRARKLTDEEILTPSKGAAVKAKARAAAVAADVDQSVRSRSEALKDRAAESRATAGLKKKVEGPVTAEELRPGREAAPADIRSAEKRLIDDLQANHPHLLDEADLQPPKQREGAGREHQSVLSRVPLTRDEFGRLADRTRETAVHEAKQITDGTWNARDSVVGKLLDVMHLRPESEAKLKAVVKDLTSVDPQMLRKVLGRAADKLTDSSLAKSIVRGSDVVRATQPKNVESVRANARDANEAYDGARVSQMNAKAEPEPEAPASHGRARIYSKDLPANISDVVSHWAKVIEKNAPDTLPKQIHIMTPDQAYARYGLDPQGGQGFTGELTGPGGKKETVIAMNWNAFGKDSPAAVEMLAHEMGHVISDKIYTDLPKADRTAVDSAFKDWLANSGRGTPNEQMASRLPPALAEQMRAADGNVTRAYASEFREWIADETAKWLVTDKKPASAVDRFFAKIAAAMKALYAQIDGRGRPTEAVQQMMDNWVANGRALKENDAAARTLDMDYIREPAEQPTAGETARAKIDTKAMQARMEATVNGAMQLGKDVGSAIAGEPGNLKRSLNNAIGSVSEGKTGDIVRKLSHAVSSMTDMVGRYGGEKNGKFGEGFTRWDHAMRLAEKYSKDAQQQGQLAMEKAQRLSTPVRNALEDLMYKSTVYGVHPDEAFGTGKNAHLRDEDSGTQDGNQRRWGEVKALWDQMKGIQGDPQQVYKDLREAMATLHHDTFEARREALDQLPLDAAAKEEGHRMLNSAEERMLEGPYFPLVREGSYITTATMPAKFVGEFDTRAEADQAARREKANNPHAEMQIEHTGDGTYAVHAGEKAVYFHDTLKDAKNARASIEAEMREAWQHQSVGKAFDDLMAGDTGERPIISDPMTTVDFYRKAEVPTTGSFLTALNKLKDSQHIDPQAYRQMAEMYVESLPETSPRKAFLRRENIRGANRRMVAGYSRRLMGAAHAYGQTKIATERNKAWGQMYKHRGDRPDYGQVMSDVYQRQEILAKRMVHNPLNTFASVVQDASSFMSLSFSPAFALQQMIQPLVLSAPVLAARMTHEGKAVGYAKTMDALKQAYSDAPSFFLKRGGQQWAHELKRVLGTYGGDGQTLQESAHALIEKFGKTDEEREMLRYMNDRGTLDFSFLNAVTDATTQSAAGSKAKAIMRLSMAFPQQIEAMNRTVTGLAAYRLAREARNMDHADAVREANAVVSQTHGDYSRYNRPSVFNRPLAGMALQFKMYTQFMYSLLASNVAHAMNPALSKAERTQAVRTLGYVMGSHAVIGGAVGLGPVAAAAKLGLGAVMYGLAGAGMIDKKKRDQTMGDYIASETEHYGDEMLGKGNGRALRSVGTYGLLGLLGTNMANKIAIPDLTDTRFTGKPLSERATPGDAIDRFALSSLGSVYSNGKRLANGTGELLHGNVKAAAQQILPAAPRALLNAATEAQNGVVTGSGQVIKGHDQISPYATFLRGIGLNSADTDMTYDDRGRLAATKDRINVERSDLVAAYRNAKTAEDRADVMAQVADFNHGRAKELQLSGASLSRAVSSKAQQPSKEDAAVKRAIGMP